MPLVEPRLAALTSVACRVDASHEISWLLAYPMFQDALRREETSFEALAAYVKLPALRRIAQDGDPRSARWTDLSRVRASYIEVSTTCVVDAIRGQLSTHLATACEPSDALETLSLTFPAEMVPFVARPPCLLSPGDGIFLDSWQRFFAYWSRHDRTIPLLAVDWPILYGCMVRMTP